MMAAVTVAKVIARAVTVALTPTTTTAAVVLMIGC
jgi:hypothetical protein